MDGNTEQGRNIRDDSSSVHPKLRGKRKATDDPTGTCFYHMSFTSHLCLPHETKGLCIHPLIYVFRLTLNETSYLHFSHNHIAPINIFKFRLNSFPLKFQFKEKEV